MPASSVYNQLAPLVPDQSALRDLLESSGAPTCDVCGDVPTTKFVKFGSADAPCRTQQRICADCYKSYVLTANGAAWGNQHKCPFACGLGGDRGLHPCNPTGETSLEDSNVNQWASSVNIRCPHEGCTERLQAGPLVAHARECKHRLVVKCPNDCNVGHWPMVLGECKLHLSSECPDRRVRCLLHEQCGCDWHGPFHERDAHLLDPHYAQQHTGALAHFINKAAEETKRAAEAWERAERAHKRLRTEVGQLDSKLEDVLESGVYQGGGLDPFDDAPQPQPQPQPPQPPQPQPPAQPP
ncbi:MAG: hypothetical protein ACKVI4_14495, partial [Actinomycetales bacterium]